MMCLVIPLENLGCKEVVRRILIKFFGELRADELGRWDKSPRETG